MTKDRHQLTPTPVRIPADLKAPLQAAAKANDRSLNGEILARLRASLIPSAPAAQKGNLK
ncbi:Arc family DNA-binding protein [Comamonas koreensis]|uniref:Arc family DNA-binding protein n=1 Tax=Comamonas koreensis TaxID=160825 RepID=UPI0038B335F8